MFGWILLSSMSRRIGGLRHPTLLYVSQFKYQLTPHPSNTVSSLCSLKILLKIQFIRRRDWKASTLACPASSSSAARRKYSASNSKAASKILTLLDKRHRLAIVTKLSMKAICAFTGPLALIASPLSPSHISTYSSTLLCSSPMRGCAIVEAITLPILPRASPAMLTTSNLPPGWMRGGIFLLKKAKSAPIIPGSPKSSCSGGRFSRMSATSSANRSPEMISCCSSTW
mmetsp:Transcript_696/g.1595  ORF Transcript_696/g.1595 Transcript_696/m.1595 type:complete len:228 (-) Transcript_696:465-1148(-)